MGRLGQGRGHPASLTDGKRWTGFVFCRVRIGDDPSRPAEPMEHENQTKNGQF